MPIYEHTTEFAGKQVEEWDPERGIGDPSATLYRLSVSYDEAEKGRQWSDVLEEYLGDPKAGQTTGLVVGPWGDMATGSEAGAVALALAAARDRLPNLRALFFGDIVVEESEISWINQTGLRPLFDAYPLLEHFTVRGGDGLSLVKDPVMEPPMPRPGQKPGFWARIFGKRPEEPAPAPEPTTPPPPAPREPGPLSLPHLRSLVIQTGGLDAEVVREITAADLPALEHLELWLGEENYGATVTLADLEQILSGRLFPRLHTLALKNSEIQDEIAGAVAASALLERIRVLDLSMGTLTDEGAEALLASPAIARLEKLDVHHHFLSPGMMARLEALGIEVDVSEREEADEDGGEVYRYVAVGE